MGLQLETSAIPGFKEFPCCSSAACRHSSRSAYSCAAPPRFPWLTDYTISHDLQADYQAHSLTGGDMTHPLPPSGAKTPALLTQEAKDEVGREIDSELEVENGEAALETAEPEATTPRPTQAPAPIERPSH